MRASLPAFAFIQQNEFTLGTQVFVLRDVLAI